MGKLDLEVIDNVVGRCEDFGLRAKELEKAKELKRKIILLLQKLEEAMERRDLSLLEVLAECEDFQLPAHYLAKANQVKCEMEKALNQLKLAMKRKSLNEIREALRACEEKGFHSFTADAEIELRELERCFAALQEGVSARKLQLLKPAIQACQEQGVMPEELEEALSLQQDIEGIFAKIFEASEKKDIAFLNEAILDYHRAALPPSSEVDAAEALKGQIEMLLAHLGVAVQLLDIQTLKAAIAECETAGLPEQDLNEAMLAKSSIERMRLVSASRHPSTLPRLATLNFCIDCKDNAGIAAAIKDNT